jgi:hypothetical protein
MNMPGRTYQASPTSKYRYSINGQEKESELNENITTAEYWEYDSRIGRRWNPDPVVNISESRYATFGNNPVYYSDPNGDFKTEAGAKWYKFWHGGKVSQCTSGTRAGEWRVSRKATDSELAKEEEQRKANPDQVIVTGYYTYGNNSIVDRVAVWVNSVEFTSQSNLEVTVGVQAGVNVKVNSFINLKAEGGILVNKLLDVKADAYHMERAKISYGFEVGEDHNYLQKNFVNIGLEAGIPKTVLTGNLGYDYVETEKYYNGYYGPITVDTETSQGWNGNLKLSKFKSKDTGPVITNKPSAKVGVNTEKKFYGLDVSASVRLIFGVKGQFKIGFQKK